MFKTASLLVMIMVSEILSMYQPQDYMSEDTLSADEDTQGLTSEDSADRFNWDRLDFLNTPRPHEENSNQLMAAMRTKSPEFEFDTSVIDKAMAIIEQPEIDAMREKLPNFLDESDTSSGSEDNSPSIHPIDQTPEPSQMTSESTPSTEASESGVYVPVFVEDVNANNPTSLATIPDAKVPVDSENAGAKFKKPKARKERKTTVKEKDPRFKHQRKFQTNYCQIAKNALEREKNKGLKKRYSSEEKWAIKLYAKKLERDRNYHRKRVLESKRKKDNDERALRGEPPIAYPSASSNSDSESQSVNDELPMNETSEYEEESTVQDSVFGAKDQSQTETDDQQPQISKTAWELLKLRPFHKV